MNFCKSLKFVFVVFEKKCWCSISILNKKSSIVSRITSNAFFLVRARILKTFLDLWFLFFVQTIKRQNSNDVSMKNRNAWRNSIFFFVRWSFSFHLLFWDIHVKFALCASRIKRVACVASSKQRRHIFDFNAILISTRILLTTQSRR